MVELSIFIFLLLFLVSNTGIYSGKIRAVKTPTGRWMIPESEAERSGCWYCPLVIHDKLLESRPWLLKLKLEVLESWCMGRRHHILELSRKYPELVKVTVKPEEISENYPCGKICGKYTVRRIRGTLKTITELKFYLPKPSTNTIES